MDEAWDEAWDIIIEEEGWKEEKKGDHGDVVKSKKNKKGFRLISKTNTAVSRSVLSVIPVHEGKLSTPLQ